VLDENAVAKAHAVYTPFTLAIYDVLVHGLSNASPGAVRRGAWSNSIAKISLPIIWRRGWARVCFSIALRRQS
jgi:hypothetical protein